MGLYICVIYKRKVFKIPTNFKLLQSQFVNEKIVKHPNSKNISFLISKQINEIENRILEGFKINDDLTLEIFLEILKGKKIVNTTLNEFLPNIIEQLAGKISTSTQKNYKCISNDLNNYDANINFNSLSVLWLNNFEANLRARLIKDRTETGNYKGLHNNTINNKMKTLKAIINKAAEQGYIEKKEFEKYKVPKYINSIPEYISEDEMSTLYQFAKSINRPGHQLAVYYFLLSCYTGFRISDLKKFDYNKVVQDDTIVIRAKKNGSIVSSVCKKTPTIFYHPIFQPQK